MSKTGPLNVAGWNTVTFAASFTKVAAPNRGWATQEKRRGIHVPNVTSGRDHLRRLPVRGLGGDDRLSCHTERQGRGAADELDWFRRRAGHAEHRHQAAQLHYNIH